MTSLGTLQEELQAYVLRGTTVIAARVVGTARVPAGTRLAIYGNAYRARLTDALASNYPALAKLAGAGGFAELAGDYIRAHDSHGPSIRWYGDRLAEFLASDARYAEVPLLTELARWEWALSEAFDAADAQPLGAAALAAVAPERWASLCFVWHPSVRSLALSWNAPEICRSLKNDEERPAAEVLDVPRCWLVWRQALEVRFRSLDAGEAHAIDMSRAGGTFGEVCEMLATLDAPRAAARASAWLREWVDTGLIVNAS
ncbi:MAG TPA: DNA-binding domain-containing protein [Steroidobacteraceae bacterium]|nr:DNA-binding domain-containing protein [Steroidobacteraceae bacterium]